MKRFSAIILLLASLCMLSFPLVAADGGQRLESVSTASNVPNAQGANGHIHFYAGSEPTVFSVYSITGQLLRTLRVPAEGHTSVEFPKGFYIVKYGSQGARKVVVK